MKCAKCNRDTIYSSTDYPVRFAGDIIVRVYSLHCPKWGRWSFWGRKHTRFIEYVEVINKAR